MGNNLSNQCPNCGAGLQAASNTFKCPYCGSTFNPNSTTPKNNQSSTGLPYYDDADTPKRSYDPLSNTEGLTTSAAQKKTSGVAPALFLLAVLVILISIVIAIQHEGTGYSSATDSVTMDTTSQLAKTDSIKQDSSSPNADIIKQLSLIKVDSLTFRKLYKAARKKHDQFSGSTFIYDKSSPQYVNYNATYAYIDKISQGSTLRFSIQYTATEWLFIKKITFNADGENYDYEPEFKTVVAMAKSGNGATNLLVMIIFPCWLK